MDKHRLTWRMYIPVVYYANSKQEAIETALHNRPNFIPKGTLLYYGAVEGEPVGIAE